MAELIAAGTIFLPDHESNEGTKASKEEEKTLRKHEKTPKKGPKKLAKFMKNDVFKTQH